MAQPQPMCVCVLCVVCACVGVASRSGKTVTMRPSVSVSVRASMAMYTVRNKHDLPKMFYSMLYLSNLWGTYIFDGDYQSIIYHDII